MTQSLDLWSTTPAEDGSESIVTELSKRVPFDILCKFEVTEQPTTSPILSMIPVSMLRHRFGVSKDSSVIRFHIPSFIRLISPSFLDGVFMLCLPHCLTVCLSICLTASLSASPSASSSSPKAKPVTCSTVAAHNKIHYVPNNI